MQIQDLTFSRLSNRKETKAFDCGDQDLNDFIRNQAWNFQKELLAVTYIFENNHGEIVAFFSLSNDSLSNQNYERWNNLSRKVSNPKRRKDYPAIKIGRLGVSNIHHGNQLGSQVLTFIKSWFKVDNKSGCRFLLVDSYNKPKVIDFYRKYDFGFLTDKDESSKTRLMYFDLIKMIPM